IVQRADCDSVRPARDVDPAYGAALDAAAAAGVEALAYGCHVAVDGIAVARPLPVKL
ncbi:MAG: DNA/RNA nuclease SfsA, partial [Alphaproteobacteria bacterium]